MTPFSPAKSIKLEVNSLEQQVRVPANGTLRLFSDRSFHVAIDQEEDVLSVSNSSMPIPAMQPHYLAGTNKDTFISFVLLDGETDGTLWLTTGARG